MQAFQDAIQASVIKEILLSEADLTWVGSYLRTTCRSAFDLDQVPVLLYGNFTLFYEELVDFLRVKVVCLQPAQELDANVQLLFSNFLFQFTV